MMMQCLTRAANSRIAGLSPQRLAAARARRYSVVFFGTDEFSLPTLTALHDSLSGRGPHPGLVTSLRVVCPGDRPTGRGQRVQPVPVKAWLQGLPTPLEVQEVPYGVKTLASWGPPWFPLPPQDGTPPNSTTPRHTAGDIGVVVSFGYFIRPHILDALPQGAINIHPSLLPKYRGAAPIPAAILAGETSTGVSIIEVARDRFDAGGILAQEAHPIAEDDTTASLSAHFAARGAALALDVLSRLAEARQHAASQAALIAAHEAAGGGPLPKAPKLAPDVGRLTWGATAGGEEGALARPGAAAFLRMVRALDEESHTNGVFTHMEVASSGGGAGAGGGRGRGADAAAAPPTQPALEQRRVKIMTAVRVPLRQPGSKTPGVPAEALASAAAACPPGSLRYHAPSKTLLLRLHDEGNTDLPWVALTRLHVQTRPKPVSGPEFAFAYKVTPLEGREGGGLAGFVDASLDN